MINESYLGRRNKSFPVAALKLLLLSQLLHSLFECISPLFIRPQCQNSHLTPLDYGLGNVIKTDPSATTRSGPTNQWHKKYEYNQNWFLGQQKKRANRGAMYSTFFKNSFWSKSIFSHSVILQIWHTIQEHLSMNFIILLTEFTTKLLLLLQLQED